MALKEATVHRLRPMTTLSLIVALLVTLAACTGGAAPTSAPAETAAASADDGAGGGGEGVSRAGQRFSPPELTIPAGTTVTFTDTSSHTVTEGTDGTPVDDPIVDEEGGADIEVTFDEPGTYN